MARNSDLVGRRRIKPIGVERTDGSKQWFLSHDQAFALDSAFHHGYGKAAKRQTVKADGECSWGTAAALVSKGLATWADRTCRHFNLTDLGRKVAR